MANETAPTRHIPEQNGLTAPPAPCGNRKEPPCILAVTRNGHMSEHVMEYALSVARRLQYSIVAVHVDTLPLFGDRGRRRRLFAAAVEESAAQFLRKARDMAVTVEHLSELGKIGPVVAKACHAKRRIEFVVIDKGIRLEEVARHSPVPVFPVSTTQPGHVSRTIFHNPKEKGVFAMSTTSRKRHLKDCMIFGALTSGLYAAVFMYQDIVMTQFTRGGLFALLPVATVFAVSYFHGNFTSAFWSALGIEASKKGVARRVGPELEDSQTVTAPRPDTRPRAQLNA